VEVAEQHHVVPLGQPAGGVGADGGLGDCDLVLEVGAGEGGSQTPQVVAQEQAAASSLADMQAAIAGASNRAAEFNDVRALALVPGERTGADSQVNDLSARIAEMRKIADSLAADV
jgi:hypothetical protein